MKAKELSPAHLFCLAGGQAVFISLENHEYVDLGNCSRVVDFDEEQEVSPIANVGHLLRGATGVAFLNTSLKSMASEFLKIMTVPATKIEEKKNECA